MDGRRVGGRYRLLERRAVGGMASVWRGRDERTGREVAVKLLHPHLAADADARRRLRREARATETLDHPNVVGVRDVVADRDMPAVVMEYVHGRSLGERLAAEPRLPEEEALRIARDVSEGLAAAHRRGIVHRDVKPGNILLDIDGRARLGDFGIAAELDAAPTVLTAEHGVIGTLRYMAPERLLGEDATPATDVWGMGAVLYEMLAGRPAYDATLAPTGQRVLPERPAGIGDRTWAIVRRALATDPGQRYPDGAALAAALAALPGIGAAPDAPTAVAPVRPVQAPAAAVARQTPLGDRRHPAVRARPRRAAVAALGLGAVVLVGALLAGGPGAGSDAEGGSTGAGAAAATASPDPKPTEAPASASEARDADGHPRGGRARSRGRDGDHARGGDKGKDGDKGRGEDKGRGGDAGRGD